VRNEDHHPHHDCYIRSRVTTTTFSDHLCGCLASTFKSETPTLLTNCLTRSTDTNKYNTVLRTIIVQLEEQLSGFFVLTRHSDKSSGVDDETTTMLACHETELECIHLSGSALTRTPHYCWHSDAVPTQSHKRHLVSGPSSHHDVDNLVSSSLKRICNDSTPIVHTSCPGQLLPRKGRYLSIACLIEVHMEPDLSAQ
jgi:hypothetical protein